MAQTRSILIKLSHIYYFLPTFSNKEQNLIFPKKNVSPDSTGGHSPDCPHGLETVDFRWCSVVLNILHVN